MAPTPYKRNDNLALFGAIYRKIEMCTFMHTLPKHVPVFEQNTFQDTMQSPWAGCRKPWFGYLMMVSLMQLLVGK